jgi:carboxymethylenebutenolidase
MDRSFYAEPEQTRDGTPSIVLAMHLWGVDADTRQAAERFAAEGFAVEVPDLYAQFDAPSGDGATDYTQFLPFAKSLTTESIDVALLAAAGRLKDRFQKTKIAIAGFCMGGRIALHRTTGYSDTFSAAAIWYGAIEVDPQSVELPVVASYGADDAGIPVETVTAFEHGLHVPHDIQIYANAGHAFCDSTRAAYEPSAAQDSWRRTVNFLKAHLST